MELLRPILELGVVIPGMLLAYFPVKSSLKQPLSKLVLWLVLLLALLCAAGGVVCYAHRMPTAPMLAALTLLAVVIYIKTLRISLWKSGTIALSVCAVFACINSLCRAINAAMLIDSPQAQAAPWFCLRSAICYHAICWLFAAIAYYPATHSVRRMVEDENFAQTWYVFWVLPLVFIALNLFMIPKYADTLYTGRVLQGYFVISITLFVFDAFLQRNLPSDGERAVDGGFSAVGCGASCERFQSGWRLSSRKRRCPKEFSGALWPFRKEIEVISFA